MSAQPRYEISAGSRSSSRASEWGCCSSSLCREGRWSAHCSFSIIPFSIPFSIPFPIPTQSSSKASHQDRWAHSDTKTFSLVNMQLSTRQKFHLWRLKKPRSPGEMGQAGHSEATHQCVTPGKLMAPLRVNSSAADANTSVLALRYVSRSHTAKTAALMQDKGFSNLLFSL